MAIGEKSPFYESFFLKIFFVITYQNRFFSAGNALDGKTAQPKEVPHGMENTNKGKNIINEVAHIHRKSAAQSRDLEPLSIVIGNAFNNAVRCPKALAISFLSHLSFIILSVRCQRWRL